MTSSPGDEAPSAVGNCSAEAAVERGNSVASSAGERLTVSALGKPASAKTTTEELDCAQIEGAGSMSRKRNVDKSALIMVYLCRENRKGRTPNTAQDGLAAEKMQHLRKCSIGTCP